MTSGTEGSLAFAGEDIIHFGSFQLNRTRRALTKDGSPVAVGSRAMGILLALTEEPGVILSNRDLLRRVWPNTVVEEGTIRVHIALLRKILREAEPGSDYVHNVTGRGYCLVAPVSRRRAPGEFPPVQSPGPAVSALAVPPPSRRNNLPVLLTQIFGRTQTIRTLAERVRRQRFMTITGAGGSGKTTVAVSVAEAAASTYSHGVCFVDLAFVREGSRVHDALAAALCITAGPESSFADVLASLSAQSMLIVLDNCEHVVEAAAGLAESVCGAGSVSSSVRVCGRFRCGSRHCRGRG